MCLIIEMHLFSCSFFITKSPISETIFGLLENDLSDIILCEFFKFKSKTGIVLKLIPSDFNKFKIC